MPQNRKKISQKTSPKGRSKASTSKPLFFNRDESWLRFNSRVLEEAQDATNPALERLRFLAITASNLDEFTEIRIAGVLQRIEDGVVERTATVDDGMTEQERLDRLADQLHSFVRHQYDCWTQQIQPALAASNIRMLRWDDLDEPLKEFARRYFEREVDPLLTPVTIDPSHPFPRVLNKALCMALLLRRKREGSKRTSLGIVTLPRSLSRFIPLPTKGGYAFLYLHELVAAMAERMFPGYQVIARVPFRITRNSNLYLQEEESRSLLESVRSELHNRRKGDVVRLEIERGASEQIIEQLRINFELERWQVFRTEAPVNLNRLTELYSLIDLPTLKFPPFQGSVYEMHPSSANDIFTEIRRGDVLLHHPFESYSTVERFLETASSDPRVVTIKQTLYRTSSQSPMFEALLDAGMSKEVTVVVELMARFDEDSNIRWARSLEDAGVQVFHGIVGRKTHCKLALVVRRDEDGTVRRYAHLGTGNYNPVTARFYTDISMLTCRPEITSAVHRVFNYLTTEGEEENFAPLLVAPITLVQDLKALIDREAAHARAGHKARIIAKMNGLVDATLIEALYAASQAGVEIDLIVRGMCALRPGIPGVSDNIRVRSIVGRFLEHSRIFWFCNGHNEEIFCGSADWMPRNLYERCEVIYPVLDPVHKKRLRDEILEAYLQDNTKARLLLSDGTYLRAQRRTAPAFSAQEFLMRPAADRAAALPLTAKPAAAAKSATPVKSTRVKAVAAKAATRKTVAKKAAKAPAKSPAKSAAKRTR